MNSDIKKKKEIKPDQECMILHIAYMHLILIYL